MLKKDRRLMDARDTSPLSVVPRRDTAPMRAISGKVEYTPSVPNGRSTLIRTIAAVSFTLMLAVLPFAGETAQDQIGDRSGMSLLTVLHKVQGDDGDKAEELPALDSILDGETSGD